MRAERSEFPYLFYYRIIKGRCKVWAGQGANFLPGGGRGKQKRAPRRTFRGLLGDSNTATFSSVRQILCSVRRSPSRIFRCRSCIVRILDRCARVRATRFRAIGFLNRKTFCGFHKLSPKQQFFRPKNASEKKGYVPRRYIPLCLRIACFAFVHLVLRLCIRLCVWDKEAAVICAPTSSGPSGHLPLGGKALGAGLSCPQARRPCTKNTPSTSTPKAMRYQPNSRKLCFLT